MKTAPKDKIEQKIINLINAHRDEIISIGRDIWKEPELGFKERKTSARFRRHLESFGIEARGPYALTGTKGYLRGEGDHGINIALIGEMDALPMPESPYADPQTGVAHSCGHNSQMAGVMGALYALSDPEVMSAMDGNVIFFAVPAEEYVEMEFKQSLMKEGTLRYGGGKSELIRIGAFDDVDIAVGHHTAPGITASVSNHSTNGFLSKIVRFEGVAAHAAEAPFDGVDALKAASLGMHALELQRESFRDEDSVRIHGFISRGGQAMNIIADSVTMEYSVRANNIPAIESAARKFDRSMKAGATGTGCGVEIVTMPGYLPVLPVSDVRAIEEAIRLGIGDYEPYSCDPGIMKGGSTDYGDLSQLIPLLQFNTGGYSDSLHNKNLHPTDEELAYVTTARIFALTAYELLKDGARLSKDLKGSFCPSMTRDGYIRYMDEHMKTEYIPIGGGN